ncbi:MAG: membrane protein of unknown function [Promethearchaeota archaeon]|nr:MAG: membrane protein of unknown function [Candidatus Lokiarchaeota archaeon]
MIIMLLLTEFPISGMVRLPLLVMEFILVVCLIQISFIFLFRFLKQEKGLRNLQELGYFFLLLGFGLTWFFYLFSDFYAPEILISPFLMWEIGSYRYLFLNLGYLSIMMCSIFFLLCVERYKIFLLKRYLFTLLFAIYATFFVVLFIVDIRITQNFTYFFWSIFIFFLLVYLIDFTKKVQNKQNLYIGLLKYLSGIALTLVGFLFSTDLMINIFGLGGRLIGDIFQLGGLVLLSIFFLTLPPFSEFDWHEKVEALYVMNNSGICLFYKIFKDKKRIQDQNLISAAFSSINTMIDEMTQSGAGISVVKKEKENIVMYSGKFVTGVIYTSEELNYIKVLLKEFIGKFEAIYERLLKEFSGDITMFRSTDVLVKDIFEK